MRAAIFLLVLLTQTPSSSLAPQEQPQPATIEGIVVRLDNADPVSHVRLMLKPTGNSTEADQKNVFTDKLGHFIFADLEPGEYSLNAYSDGYVHLQYGQSSQNRPPKSITLVAGQKVTGIVFKLTPTASVTGRIYDAENLPLSNADVTLLKAAYDENGQKTLDQSQVVRTNDLGEYRLFWITPGKYYLSAAVGNGPSMSNNQFEGLKDEYETTYFPGTV